MSAFFVYGPRVEQGNLWATGPAFAFASGLLWLDAPGNNPHLGVGASENQRAARVATALALSAFGQSRTDLALVQLRLMPIAALLVAKHLQLDLL